MLRTLALLAQALPNPDPSAPPDLSAKTANVLSLIKWASLIAAVAALMAFGLLVWAAEHGGYGSHSAEMRSASPPSRLRPQPLGDRPGAASRQHVHQPAGVDVDDARRQQRGGRGRGGQERRLVHPDGRRGAHAGEVVDPGPAVVAHRRHGGVPAHAEALGASSHRLLAGAHPAGDLRSGRSVSTDRGAMASDSSDHVPISQAASAQRHSRLPHTSTTGRPPMGRSRTRTRRRPCPTARPPHGGHQARSLVVSTASHPSPVVSSSRWARTTNPSSPSSADTPLPSR
jgi:hypothetical protein